VRERLYRSRRERMFLGVAGGLAEWFDLDPSFVRVAFVLVTLAGGAGVLIYIALAIIVPERPEGVPVRAGVGATASAETSAETGGEIGSAVPRTRRRDDGRGAVLFGAILIIAGAWFLLQQLIPALDLDRWSPAILIAVGLILLVGATRRNDST